MTHPKTNPSSTSVAASLTPPPGQIVVYSDLWCSFAHLAIHRLHTTRARLGLQDRVSFDLRAFPLELLNGASSPRPGTDSEVAAVGRLDPEAGWLLWHSPDWTYPSTTLPALEAVQAAKNQSLTASEDLDLALRHAFWVDSANISLRPVILTAAASTQTVDVETLADDLDSGAARPTMMQHYRVARTDAITCSPHLFLPDGSDHPNPGITVTYTAEYGTGFPIVTADTPDIYDTLLGQAAQPTNLG